MKDGIKLHIYRIANCQIVENTNNNHFNSALYV